jgi:catechol 2,3-dioxygenase-like lactoylglutathione lyase family enzyme
MRRLGLLILLMMLGAAVAKDSKVADSPVRASGAFFALSVADLDASVRWYEEKLGLAVTLRPPKSGPGSVAVLEGNGLIVELVQHDQARALGVAAPGVTDPFYVHGFFKAGVLVEDFDRLLTTLRAGGVKIAHGPYEAKEGRRPNVIVEDNAGNLIHFFGSRPGT